MNNQTEFILNQILEDIDRGTLNPGDLLDEQAMIGRFEVSRTPVREAILKLEAIGIVTRRSRKGATVFKPNLADFLAILEVHAKMEGQAAGLAARRLSRDHAHTLEQSVVDCERHLAEHGEALPDRYFQCNLRFHAAVGAASGNEFLLDAIKSNARKLLAYYRARYRYKGAISRSAHEHRAIATLIVDRDAAAESMMAEHVQFDSVTAMDLLAALG